MKLFGRTGGYYLFWTGAVYLTFGLTLISLGLTEYTAVVSPVWIVMLSLPFAIPPFGRWLNMDVTWDKIMFDWFKGRKEREAEYNNVVKFPEVTKVPYVVPPAPPEPEKPARIFYRIGVTDNNRVAFSMGVSEITMTKLGCRQMIEQIEVFMNQLPDEEENADSK